MSEIQKFMAITAKEMQKTSKGVAAVAAATRKIANSQKATSTKISAIEKRVKELEKGKKAKPKSKAKSKATA